MFIWAPVGLKGRSGGHQPWWNTACASSTSIAAISEAHSRRVAPISKRASAYLARCCGATRGAGNQMVGHGEGQAGRMHRQTPLLEVHQRRWTRQIVQQVAVDVQQDPSLAQLLDR